MAASSASAADRSATAAVSRSLPIVEPGGQALFFLAQLSGLPVQLVGIAARPLRLRLGRQVAVALPGQAGGRPEPFGQGGQGEPGFLSPRQGRGVLLRCGVELGFAAARGGDAGLQRGPPGEDGGLVGLLPLELGRQRQVVVGQQPQPRIPQVSLDGGGPARDLGLAAQRLEAPAQLAGEVDEPGQVGLHRLELAQRLLLAPPVLEDAGRLLDQRAPGFGAGVQHGVELALTDDDVHLPAEARIGEKFLDVQQAAAVAVDGVLALPRPEHQPADRDFRVFDRQRAVAVVDGQRHLGAAKGRPRGGPGEDDVLHLAAAERFGALLAHDPAQRVDDVGLAGAVRADDTRDARLEAQRRGGREGLEAAQGEALEVHLASPPSCSAATPGSRRHQPPAPGAD